MPFFSELSTTPQSTDTKHSTEIVQQNQVRDAENRRLFGAEPSISFEHSDNWFLWLFLDIWQSALLPDTEHRNLSSIFAWEPNLISLEIIGVHRPQFDLGYPLHFKRSQINNIYAPRIRKRSELIDEILAGASGFRN